MMDTDAGQIPGGSPNAADALRHSEEGSIPSCSTWEDGYASREAIVSNLLALRDCATCPPFTPEQHEHIEALIRLYRRDRCT